MKSKSLLLAIIWVAGCRPIYSHPAPPPVGAPIAPLNPVSPANKISAPLPPQHFGFLNGFPRRWEVRKWALTNNTHFWLKVRMNGQPMIIFDNNARLPHLPPYKTAYFAVNQYGNTRVEAEGFLPPDFQTPVVHCKVEGEVSPLIGGALKQVYISVLRCW